jgi:hypothetical protein
MTERRLVLEPVPQVLEQDSNLDQPEVMQSTEQRNLLHAILTTIVSVLPTPPKAAAVMMERYLYLKPLGSADQGATPQDWEQGPNLDQREILASTGQLKVLQVVSCSVGHSSPP